MLDHEGRRVLNREGDKLNTPPVSKVLTSWGQIFGACSCVQIDVSFFVTLNKQF